MNREREQIEDELHNEWLKLVETKDEQRSFYHWAFNKLLAVAPVDPRLSEQQEERHQLIGRFIAIDALQSRMVFSADQHKIWKAYRDEIEKRFDALNALLAQPAPPQCERLKEIRIRNNDPMWRACGNRGHEGKHQPDCEFFAVLKAWRERKR